jgi:hypothetical protein
VTIALCSRTIVHHAQSNAALIAGTSHGEHVLARMVVPEGFEIFFRGTSAAEVDAKLIEILTTKTQPHAVA